MKSKVKRSLKVLNLIADKAANCTACVLHKNRIKSVFQSGNPNAELMFIGEAGGRTENELGEPFVGRAGKLLDSMIKAMGYKKEDVYITNICKCSPPDNRKPAPNEMNACREFLEMQLHIVDPNVIVALGATATEGLLGPGPGITKRRGQWSYRYNNEWGFNIMPTYHPAYLLRTPAAKKEAHQDLTEVNKLLKGL